MSKLVKVAIAIIVNDKNEVLISLRAKDTHQGGLWEFPGGKLEKEESALDALKREVNEELNIKIISASVFKKIQYQYPDKTVQLNIFLVKSFSGEPIGVEGQQIKWQNIYDLVASDFPLANRSIIHTLQLSDKYMITGSFENHQDFTNKLQSSLEEGIRLVQLRCKNISVNEYKQLAKIALKLCEKFSAILLLNTNENVFSNCKANGLHLTSQLLNSIESRPVTNEFFLSVSCHTQAEIEKAKKLNADIVLLSPVKKTRSHPEAKSIGWEQFYNMAEDIDVPVYALGGMIEADLYKAKKTGAQGVAAISSFWN